MHGMHNLLTRCLEAIWSKKDIEKAVAELENVRNVEPSFSARQAVKAHSMLDWLLKLGDNRKLVFMDAFLATHPLQVFLNAVTETDKIIHALHDSFDDSIDLQIELEQKSAKQNRRIISGGRGLDAVAGFHAF